MDLDEQFITAMLESTRGYVYLGPVNRINLTDPDVSSYVVEADSTDWSLSKFRFINVDKSELVQIVLEGSDILFLDKCFAPEEFSGSDAWRESIVIRTPVLYFAPANIFERCWFRRSLARYGRRFPP